MQNSSLTAALSAAASADRDRGREKTFADIPPGGNGLGIGGAGGGRGGYLDPSTVKGGPTSSGASRNKSSLSNFGRLGIGGKKSKR